MRGENRCRRPPRVGRNPSNNARWRDHLLNDIFVAPFADMIAAPDFLLQVLWEGLVSGILYALIALGLVLIFRSSRIFNFAQGIMVVFAALTLVGLHAAGVPAWVSLALTLVVMLVMESMQHRMIRVGLSAVVPVSTSGLRTLLEAI